MTPTLQFLGGTDEIGASSLLLTIGAHRLIIDAGLRHKARKGLVTPTFEALSEIEPTGIVLTHAHLDHTGALPALHRDYPTLPIYTTRATYRLISLLLADSLKIMSLEVREGETPLFTQHDLERTLAHVLTVDFNEPIDLPSDDPADRVTLTFEPAGHILGAGMLIARSEGGDVCISGDICATPQLTIPAMSHRALDVDTLVVESTYGGKTHRQRGPEEARIVRQVRETVERGGSVLIPAFAIGRAQEVLLILIRAREAGELPEVPIYIDGLVRAVCGLYPRFPELLSPWLRARIEGGLHPFYGGVAGARPIWDPAQRAKLTADPSPKVIIASSGMLIGGPSALYARTMARRPKDLIAITGYQDEESPGRAVQELAKRGGGTLRLPDGDVELKCEVATYSLSAHSDTPQLIELIERSGAERVILVHGAGGARDRLAEAIEDADVEVEVLTPSLGDTLTLSLSPSRLAGGRRVRRGPPNPLDPCARLDSTQTSTQTSTQSSTQASAQTSIQSSSHSSNKTSTHSTPHSRPPLALSPEDLQAVARQLLDQSWGARDFTPQEVAYALGYRGHQLRPERLTPLITALEADGSPFRKHPRLPNAYLVRVTPDGSLVLRGVKRPRLSRADRLDVPLTQALIEQAFKDCAHQPYKVRFPHQERRCELRFHFPEVALKECGDEVEWLRGHLGEALSVSGEVHQEALVQRTLDLMPTPWRAALYRIPSLHLSAKEVSARVCLVAIESWALAEVEEGLYSHTGFRFRLNLRPDLTPIFGPTLSSALSSVQRSALSSVQRSAHASGASPAPSLSPLSLSQGQVNDERLSLFSPERLLTPAPRGAKRRYKQVHAINEVRRCCKGHARPLKTLRPYKNHLELVFKGPPPSDELKGALKVIADASGWGLAIEVGS